MTKYVLRRLYTCTSKTGLRTIATCATCTHVASCGKIMMWRCIHDGESRVVFSLKIVVCALVSANFAAARAVWVEFFHCKGGGRAAKRVIFNVISGLVFWPCCKFSAGVYPLSCSRPMEYRWNKVRRASPDSNSLWAVSVRDCVRKKGKNVCLAVV